MFEKSLYDLIRGLRNHKGNEKEYIQNSIRECRREIKGQDMDLKATAVLKLTYLEMFGHDMSWASFNVLEVMSSPKYLQKRVGYLGAVQSFRPDTEVLMLAENLLKKDLNSPQIPTMSLPLIAIPHVISPSMANSLLSDLLPRLGHSHPAVRKKTIVTLYRLALVYPETLRPAWPRIKERLLDENEDSSVTAAVVNVVCELGWRRPQDFLPLAPRLFDLLVDGGNNWMAIKIIKLFATLTPLEPRLVKKLLPPLTTIMKTTPAMSLLYECINGIIQGGILQSAQGTTEGDEIARLCVGKLRGMLVIEGDPNLKYVALLAFNKIVEFHPDLVSMHEDVIMECLDDADISIRLRALDLVVGMVNSNNLTSIVDRLMRQLRNAPIASSSDDPLNDRGASTSVQPTADSDDEDATQSIRPAEQRSNQPPPLPEEYRTNVIQHILEMCNRNIYGNINDFDWYIDILVQLVKHTPAPTSSANETAALQNDDSSQVLGHVAFGIGSELRNVAIRVRSSRMEATRAAELLLSIDKREQLYPRSHNGGQGVLEPIAWIVGEFADLLQNADGTLTSLLHSSTSSLTPRTLSVFLQAVVKVFASSTGNQQQAWTPERKTVVSLLIAKITHYLEPLTSHPSLEVQERAVEYLELIRVAGEAVSAHSTGSGYGNFVTPPLLLTDAIPALFKGMELNPVARDAQRKVPIPNELDLDKPINENLPQLLNISDFESGGDTDNEFDEYYNQRPQTRTVVEPAANEPAANRLQAQEPEISYQQSSGDYLDQDLLAKRRAERRERHKDDPFYIPSEDNSGTNTPLGNALRTNNGDALDVDSIPIMALDLGTDELEGRPPSSGKPDPGKRKPPRRHFEILADENIGDGELSSAGDAAKTDTAKTDAARLAQSRAKKSLLQVDSSGLGSLSLEDGGGGRGNRLDIERREAEEVEMTLAMREVERLRLEMQRASETIASKEGPPDGVVVRRKKKKKQDSAQALEVNGGEAEGAEAEGGKESKKKKKKRKKVVHDAQSPRESEPPEVSASKKQALTTDAQAPREDEASEVSASKKQALDEDALAPNVGEQAVDVMASKQTPTEAAQAPQAGRKAAEVPTPKKTLPNIQAQLPLENKVADVVSPKKKTKRRQVTFEEEEAPPAEPE